MGNLNSSVVRFLPQSLVRAVCLILTLTLTVGDPSWAAGVSDVVRANFSHDIRDVMIPARLGTVTDRWFLSDAETRKGGDTEINAPGRRVPASPRPVVVLIQDLHANIDVQKNIAGIIEFFYRRAGLHSIYSEAAFGPCDVSLLRTLPSRAAQGRFEKKLLSQALIAGDEMAAARVGQGPLSPVKLFGVDDPLLYLANVQAFRDLVANAPQVTSEWRSMRDFIVPGATPRLRRHFELIEKLLSLKLVDHEWEEYRANRQWTPQGSPRFHASILAAERFYTAAEARNGAMADNLLAQLGVGEYGSKGVTESLPATTSLPRHPVTAVAPVALLTGGFHTANIAHTLKAHGINFMVVTPQVEKLDQEELYVRSMTEPPHETVRAVTASNRQFAMLKSKMLQVGMGESTRWLRRYFSPSRARAKQFPGPVLPRFNVFSWAIQKAPRLTAGALTFFIFILSSTKAAAQSLEGVTQHTIQWGETLTKIAQANHTTISVLQKLNQIVDVNKITAGKALELPATVLPSHPLANLPATIQVPDVTSHVINMVSAAPQDASMLPLWILGITAATLVGAVAFMFWRARAPRKAPPTRVRVSGFSVLRSVWNDQREAGRRLKAMEMLWAKVQAGQFDSQEEALKAQGALKNLLAAEHAELHKKSNFARASDWREFGQRIGKAVVSPVENGEGWILSEKVSSPVKRSARFRMSRAPPTVEPHTKRSFSWKTQIVQTAAALLLVVQSAAAFITPFQSDRAGTPAPVRAAVQASAQTLTTSPIPKAIQAPRRLAQAAIGAVQNAPSATPGTLFPATKSEVRQDGQIPRVETVDGTWGYAPGFGQDDLRLLEALQLVSTPGGPLAVRIRMDEGHRGEILDRIMDLETLDRMDRQKELQLYLNPVAGESVDEMGRGRVVNANEIDSLEDQGRTLQIWHTDSSRAISQLLFGTNRAGLKLNETRIYQAGRKILDEVLRVTGTSAAIRLFNPKTGERTPGVPIGAIVATNDDKQPALPVEYFNKTHFLYKTADEERDGRKEHANHWPFLITPNGTFEIGFYSYDKTREGYLKHISGDALRGDPLKANADKMKLKHARGGKLLDKADPAYNQPELWDELIFGDNSGKADLAESMVGLLGAQADNLSAKKNAKLAKIGAVVSMATAGMDLAAGSLAVQNNANAGVNSAWAHLGAAITGASMSIFSAFTGVPETMNVEKMNAMAATILKQAHPSWSADEIQAQVQVIAEIVKKDPQLQRVFALSQDRKNEFVIKAIANVVASGVQVGGAVQDLKRQKDLKAARGVVGQFINANDHSKDLIDLNPEKWQDIVSQLSPADQEHFMRIMGPIFTDGTSDARYMPFDRTHFSRNPDGTVRLTSSDINAILVKIGSLDPQDPDRIWLVGTEETPGHLLELPTFEKMLRAEMSKDINLANILVIAGDPANLQQLKELFPTIDFSKFQDPFELLKNGTLPYDIKQELEKLVVAYGNLPLDQQLEVYKNLFGNLTPQERILRDQIPSSVNLTNILFMAADPETLQQLRSAFPGVDFTKFEHALDELQSGKLSGSVQFELEKLVAQFGEKSAVEQQHLYNTLLGKPTPQELHLRSQMPVSINLANILIIAGEPSHLAQLKSLFPTVDFSQFQNPLQLIQNGKLPLRVQQELDKLMGAFGQLSTGQQHDLYANLFGKLTPQESAIRDRLGDLMNRLSLSRWIAPAMDNAQQLTDLFLASGVNRNQLPDFSRLNQQSQLEKFQMAVSILQANNHAAYEAALHVFNVGEYTAGARSDVDKAMSLQYQLVKLQAVIGNLGGVGPQADFFLAGNIEKQLADLGGLIGNLGGLGPYEDFQKMAPVEIQLIELAKLIGNLGGVGPSDKLADTANKLNLIQLGLHGVIGSPDNIGTVATAVAGVDRLLRLGSIDNAINHSPLKVNGDLEILGAIGFAMDLFRNPAPGHETRLGVPVGDPRDPQNRWYQNFGLTSNIFSVIKTVTGGKYFKDSPSLADPAAYRMFIKGFPWQTVFNAIYADKFQKMTNDPRYYAVLVEDYRRTSIAHRLWRFLNPNAPIIGLSEAEFHNLDLESISDEVKDGSVAGAQSRFTYFRDRRTGKLVFFTVDAYTRKAQEIEKALQRGMRYHEVQTQGGTLTNYQYEPDAGVEFQVSPAGVKATAREFADASLRSVNPVTGLPESYRGGQAEEPNKHTTNPYDIGNTIILWNETGDVDAAYQLSQNLLERHYAERQSKVGDKNSPFAVINGLRTDLETGGVSDGSVSTGPNARLVTSLLRLRDRIQDPKKKELLLKQARQLADYLLAAQRWGGSFPQGFDAGADKVTSNETNFRVWAVFKDLSRTLKGGDSEKYARAAGRAQGYLKTQFDAANGYFYQGAVDGTPTRTYATDVNALAIQTMGPIELDQWLGAGTADRIQQSFQRSEVTLSFETPDGQTVRVSGHDATDAEGRRAAGDRAKLLVPEITSHVIAADQIMAAFHGSNGEDALARSLRDQAAQLSNNLSRITLRTAAGASRPYAVSEDGIASGEKLYPDSLVKTPATTVSEAGGIWGGFNELWVNPERVGLDPSAAAEDLGVQIQRPLKSQVSPVSLSETVRSDYLYGGFAVGEVPLQDYKALVRALKSDQAPGKKLLLEIPGRRIVYQEGDRLVTITPIASPAQIEKDIQKQEKEVRDIKDLKSVRENGGMIVVYEENGQYVSRFLTAPSFMDGMRIVNQELDRLESSKTDDELAQIEEDRWVYTDTFEGHDNAKFILVFPAGKATSRTRPNKLTGVMETRVYREGVVRDIFTAKTITHLDVTDSGREQASQTFQNTGTLENPVEGPLVSQTQTIRMIHSRNRSERRVVKKVTYPALSREEVQVYGRERLPMAVVNNQYVVMNHFDADGRIDGSTAYMNEGTPENWQAGAVAIISRRLGFVTGTKNPVILSQDQFNTQSWLTVQDSDGRTLARYDGSWQDGRFTPEMVSLVPNGDFGQSLLGLLGVAPVSESFEVVRRSGRARDSRREQINLPGITGNFERSNTPMGRSRIKPTGQTSASGETRFFDANGRFTVERQDLMLGTTWDEEHDSYGRTFEERHKTYTLTIGYDGKTSARTTAVRTDKATGRVTTTWTYGKPTTLEQAGVQLPGAEMRQLGITRGTRFIPVTKTPARGDPETEFSIPGHFAGRAPVALLPNGQIRLVDSWMGPTNLASRSRVFDRYGDLLKTYTARLSFLARWTADNPDDPQPSASDLDGTVMTVVEEVDANAPNVKTIDYRVGEYILSRQYLAPNGSVVSNLYYTGSPEFQVPAYETNSTGRVAKRFHVFEDGTDLVLAGYAPDGSTLLEINRRDRTGHLLWEWQFLSHSMRVNRYQQVRIDDERVVNENGAHETITRTDVYRVSPTQLGFASPVINPLDLPRATSFDEERGPAPVPANEDALSRNLAPTNGQPVGKLIDPTINDQLEGNRRPRIHLNSKDEVDEIYEISPMDAQGNVRRTVYRLPPGQRYIQRETRAESMADYQRLLEAAKQATPIPEVKVQDALGRQTDVIAGDYHTHHEYVGNSTQLQISTLRFKGNLVWTNYYPGFQSYNQALRGLPLNQILSGFPLNFTPEQRAALLQRIAGVGLVANPQYSGYDSLRPSIRTALQNEGLIGDTVLQVAIQVSENGGISADYRLPADPVEQLQMSNHGADRSVNTQWNGRFAQQSFKLDSRNEVIASYRTLPTVRADTVIPSAQMESVAAVGIKADTQLPVVEESLYAPEGRIIERSYAIREEAVDVGSGRRGYDVNVHWTNKVMATNTRYLIPNNPMGVDIAVRYAWDGLAINQWWLMGTPNTRAPLGTLPGSVLYEAKARSPGSKVYDRRGQIRIQGINGQFRVVEVHYYNVISNDPRGKEQRGEAYEVSTGRLTQRLYNWVRLRLANVVPLTKGIETVNYDPALALEIATSAEGRLDGQTTPPTRTKDLLQTDLLMVGHEFHENQLWWEIDPLMESGAKTWDRRIFNGVAQPPVQKLVTDTISEWKTFYRQHTQFVWGLILSFFLGYWGLKGLAARFRQKDERREAARVPPVVPVERPSGRKPDEILQKGRHVSDEEGSNLDQAVRDILNEWGVPNVQEYNILNRVRAEVRNFRTLAEAAHTDDMQIFAELMRGVEDWRSRVGRTSGRLQPLGDGKDELRRVVLLEWLTEEMNRDGFAAIADLPSLLFYQYDKVVGMHNQTIPAYTRFGSRGDIGRHVRGEARSLEQYLRAQYLTRNDKGQPVLKAGRITYDDMSDFFDNLPTPSNPTAEMERKFQLINFLDQYDEALAKGESAQFLRKLTPGDKTFDDKIGIRAMARNLRSILVFGFTPGVWVLLAPLAALAVNSVGWYGVTVALLIPYLLATRMIGKGTFEQWKTSALARSQLLHFASYYPVTMASFLAVSYYLNLHGWMAIERLMFMDWQIWSPALSAGIFMTMTLFTFFAQLVTATVMGSFYSIFALRRTGMGDVQSWKHLRDAYFQAQQKFMTVMISENAKKYWKPPEKQEELWNLFWATFVNQHLRNESRGDYLITEEERQMLLKSPDHWIRVKDPEAEWRIKRALEGFLLTMPHARSWDQIPPLSVMVTGFNEPVYAPFEKLNATSDKNPEVNAGDYTDLNKVIDVYPRNWIEFARTFDPETRRLLTQHLGQIPKNRAALLPSHQLSDDTKRKIEKWVSTRTQPLEKTVEEIAIIHEAYMFTAYIQFPYMTESEREKLVNDKLQIFINYNSMGLQGRDAVTGEFVLPAFLPHITTKDQLNQQVARIQSLMAKFPYMDWRWGADRMVRGDIENTRGRVPTSPAILTLAQGRKPFAQSEVLPFADNNKILFFDVNASVHWEEVLKIPLSLAEFEQDPQLKFILFGEYIYNRPLGWATDAAGLGEEAWTQEEQEFLSMFGALGFYGHSAIIDREALIRAGGYPHEFSGEDTIMTIKFWQLRYKTLHRMYVLLGKSRWAVYNGGMAPTGRWAQNTSEYLLTRWLPRLIGGGNTHIAQIAVAFKSLSFYPKKPLIPLLNDLYIGLIILLGVSETVGTQGIVALGIMGALLNQGQALQAWFHEMLRKGIFWGTLDFGALFPAIYTSFVGIITNLGQRFHSALVHGVGGFAVSSKGMDQRWKSFSEIYYGEEKAFPSTERWTLWKTKIPMGLVTQTSLSLIFAFGVLNPWTDSDVIRSYSLLGLFFGQHAITYLLVRLFPKLRRELWSDNAAQRSAVRVQVAASIPSMVRVLVSLWLWGGIGDHWYWWWRIGVSVAVYWISSFSWQRRQFVVKQVINESEMGHPGWAKFWDNALQTLIYASFLSSAGLIVAATYLASPMFTLFGFSIFYLGVPFATCLVPFYGNVRPIKRMWEKTQNLLKSLGNSDGGPAPSLSSPSPSVPPPAPPSPYQTITVEEVAPVHKPGDARWKAREALYAEASNQNYPFPYSKEALESTILNRPFLKDQTNVDRSVVTPIPENADGAQVQRSIQLFVAQLRKTQAAQAGKLLFAENQLGAYALHTIWVRSSDFNAPGTLNEDQIEQVFASLKPFRMQLERASLNPVNGRIFISGYDEGESLVKGRGRIVPHASSPYVNFPVATVTAPLTDEERQDLIDFIKTHEQSQFGSFTVLNAYLVEHKNDMLRNATAVRRFDLGGRPDAPVTKAPASSAPNVPTDPRPLTSGTSSRMSALQATTLAGLKALESRIQELRAQVTTDALTGVLNKTAFESITRELVALARHDRRHRLSVVYLDLDKFKDVNDTYGHAVGDEVLAYVGETLRTVVRREEDRETIGRIGNGEEFAVVLPNTDLGGAIQVGELIRAGIEKKLSEILGKPLPNDRVISVSAGVASFDGKESFESFLARADEALYKAKSNGRNTVKASKGKPRATKRSTKPGIEPIKMPYAGDEAIPSTPDLLAQRIADLENQIKTMEEQLPLDGMTGLLKKDFFGKMGHELVAIANRAYRKIPPADRRSAPRLSLVYIDIDEFKKLNDVYGHKIGDQALQYVASKVHSSLRPEAERLTAGRIGGEEFAILLPDTDEAQATNYAEALRADLQSKLSEIVGPQKNGDRPLTVSMGVASLRAGETFEELSERADQALYDAKRGGRNRVVASIENSGLKNPISTWGLLKASMVSAVSALAPIAIAYAGVHQAGLPEATLNLGALLSVLPAYAAQFFIRQSIRIQRAKLEASAGRARGPDALIPEFRGAIDASEAGPERINEYRQMMAFELNGRLHADKAAMSNLSPEDQQSILAHEREHLYQRNKGITRWKELRAYHAQILHALKVQYGFDWSALPTWRKVLLVAGLPLLALAPAAAHWAAVPPLGMSTATDQPAEILYSGPKPYYLSEAKTARYTDMTGWYMTASYPANSILSHSQGAQWIMAIGPGLNHLIAQNVNDNYSRVFFIRGHVLATGEPVSVLVRTRLDQPGRAHEIWDSLFEQLAKRGVQLKDWYWTHFDLSHLDLSGMGLIQAKQAIESYTLHSGMCAIDETDAIMNLKTGTVASLANFRPLEAMRAHEGPFEGAKDLNASIPMQALKRETAQAKGDVPLKPYEGEDFLTPTSQESGAPSYNVPHDRMIDFLRQAQTYGVNWDDILVSKQDLSPASAMPASLPVHSDFSPFEVALFGADSSRPTHPDSYSFRQMLMLKNAGETLALKNARPANRDEALRALGRSEEDQQQWEHLVLRHLGAETGMPPEEQYLLDHMDKANPAVTDRSRAVALLGASRRIRTHYGDVVRTISISKESTGVGRSMRTTERVVVDFEDQVSPELKPLILQTLRRVVRGYADLDPVVVASDLPVTAGAPDINHSFLTQWLAEEPANETLRRYLEMWEKDPHGDRVVEHMVPGSGVAMWKKQGEMVRLAAYSQKPGEKVELWYNASASGEWKSHPTSPVPGRPGWNEVVFPVAQSFEYTFRMRSDESQPWRYMPLTHGNGRISVRGHMPRPIRPAESPTLRSQISVLMAAMESEFDKVGGESDYVRDMSRNIAEQGHISRLVTPLYGKHLPRGVKAVEKKLLNLPINGGTIQVMVHEVVLGPRRYHYFVEDPSGALFHRTGDQKVYHEADKARGAVESIVLSQAVCFIPGAFDFAVDAVHVNDWQLALVPVYMRSVYRDLFSRIAILYVSHNISYVGRFTRYLDVDSSDPVLSKIGGVDSIVSRRLHHVTLDTHMLLGLDSELLHNPDGLEWYSHDDSGRPVATGQIALGKGFGFADLMVGVSETNLEEMDQPVSRGGVASGLEGLVARMKAEHRTLAIFNGTDQLPEDDQDLMSDGYTPFSKNDPHVLQKLLQNKRALIREHALPMEDSDFLVYSVTRVNDQKGMDLLAEAIERISTRLPKGRNIYFVVLGTPEVNDQAGEAMAKRLHELAHRSRIHLTFIEKHNPRVANRLYASGDLLAMPSRREPAGIAQQIANKYGSPVIAYLVGGLVDFFGPLWKGVGYALPRYFRGEDEEAIVHLVDGVLQAADEYWNHRSDWDHKVAQALNYDASWKSRIHLYVDNIKATITRVRGDTVRPPLKSSRQAMLVFIRQHHLLAGLHHMTARKSYATATEEELVTYAEILMDQGIVPTVDRLDVLRTLKSNPSNNDVPFAFYFGDQIDMAGFAAKAGANVLIGAGFTKEIVTQLRVQYPHVVIIEEFHRNSPQLKQDLDRVKGLSIDGLMLKDWQGWSKVEHVGPFSLPAIRKRFPDHLLIVTGGVYENQVAEVLSRAEGLDASVGFDSHAVNAFKHQAMDYAKRAGIMAEKSPRSSLAALGGAVVYSVVISLAAWSQYSTGLGLAGIGFLVASLALFGEESIYMRLKGISLAGSRDVAGRIWTHPELSPFRATRVSWHETLVHALPGGLLLDVIAAPILDWVGLALSAMGINVKGTSSEEFPSWSDDLKFVIRAA